MERRNQQIPSSSSTNSSTLRTHKLTCKPSSHSNSRFSNPNNKPNPNPAINDSHVKSGKLFQAEADNNESFNLLPVVGTCPFMCPDAERSHRERLRDLAVFERLNGDPRKSSTGLAVKKFCRTMSSKNLQPSDVRPLPVLESTLNYLLSLLDSDEHPFEMVHEFIFDRTRSIRQDLGLQNIVNDQAILMYEKMVKFHVISLHKFCSCVTIPNPSSLNYLNMEQLTKALLSLYDLYDAKPKPNSIYANEAEFRSFHVLLHLGSNSQPTLTSLSTWFRNVPSFIIKSKEMCFARSILRYFRMGNYRRFLCTTAADSSLLQYYIIESTLNEVRAWALLCINHGGYKLHPYPLAHLSRLLMMSEQDVEYFCISCGLETSIDDAGNKVLPSNQASLCQPTVPLKNIPLLSLEYAGRLVQNMSSSFFTSLPP